MKNKQVLTKISAVAMAVVMAAPTMSLLQNSILGDLISSVDKNAKVAYATGTPASVITNTAEVSSGTLDTNAANDTATVEDKFCFSSDIEVTSFTDGVTSAKATNAITYTSVITNNGVSKVEVIEAKFDFDTDYLDDAAIDFAAGAGNTVGTPSFTDAGTIRTYTVLITRATFLNPAATLTLTISGLEVKATAIDGTSYTSNLNILPTEPNFTDCAIVDPTLANNDGADSTTAVLVADLSLVKTSSGGADSSTNAVGRLNAGQTMSYTLSVANAGPSAAAANVVVVDTWPSQITPTIASGANYTASANWNCAFASPTMTCTNTNPLANGGNSSITINGTVNQTY